MQAPCMIRPAGIRFDVASARFRFGVLEDLHPPAMGRKRPARCGPDAASAAVMPAGGRDVHGGGSFRMIPGKGSLFPLKPPTVRDTPNSASGMHLRDVDTCALDQGNASDWDFFKIWIYLITFWVKARGSMQKFKERQNRFN